MSERSYPAGLDVYRIGWVFPPKSLRHWRRWGRPWQAEWEDCWYAPRAWTRQGAIRKALRWYRNGTDWKRHMRGHR